VDEYEEKKRAEAEAEAKAKAEADKKTDKPAEAQKDKKEDPDAWLPKTVEECEKLISDKFEEIEFQKKGVSQAREDWVNATDETREARKKKLDEMEALLAEAEEELSKLKTHLEKLKAAPPPAKTPNS
jgi:glutaredoxin 2